MENLILSVQVVAPLFILMTLGYLLKQIGLWNDATIKTMNNVTFRVFLPILLCMNIYKTDLQQAFDLNLIAYGVIALVCAFLALCLLIPRIEKDNKRKGVLIQGIYRSNFILFGLPLTVSLFGEQLAGVTSLLIAVIIPIYNVFAVISLELFRNGKINAKKIIKGIVTNPLIVGALLGIVLLITRIQLPDLIVDVGSDLAAIATPLALMVLGGSFTFVSAKGNIKQLIWGVSGRLIVIPGIFIPIGIGLGFRGVQLCSLLAMFAAPAAVSSFTMAQQMDADSELAGQIVVFGSACSVVTIFFWVFALKQLGYL